MDKMPSMPRNARKAKPTHECACGCGAPTKATWASGHDGRATGWAIRIERGIMGIADIPANERKGAIRMMKARGTMDAIISRGNPRRQAA